MKNYKEKFPLHVSTDGRHFTTANGDPFFWLGDTAWPLFAEYPFGDAQLYLANRAQKGFTVIQSVLAWGGGTGFETKAPGPNVAGHKPWLNDNPATPNENYFKDVDLLVQFAQDQGLVLAILPTWGYYVNDSRTITTENAAVYGRWLGRRYKNAPNIIWVIGGDRSAVGFQEVYRALAEGIQQGDECTHLLTFHPGGWDSSSHFFHFENWLDFHMIQTWTEWTKIYPMVTADRQLTPVRPVILAEGAYEDGPEYPYGPITPLIVRRQAWWAFTAGGYFTNGHNDNWRMDPGWFSRLLDPPASFQMSVFKKIATSRPWWRMIPDQSLIHTESAGDQLPNTALCAVEGNFGWIYFSHRSYVLVTLDRFRTRNIRATWINPVNGDQIDAGLHPTCLRESEKILDRNRRWFTPPSFWEDAVLGLDGED